MENLYFYQRSEFKFFLRILHHIERSLLLHGTLSHLAFRFTFFPFQVQTFDPPSRCLEATTQVGIELTELSNEIETVEREPLTILRKIYGYSTFREGQKEVIDSITSGKDTIALLPTGGGKSVIYVTSAVFMSGITIVVEPLKALMEEQVVNL